MKLQDLKQKKIGELSSLIVEKVEISKKKDTPLTQALSTAVSGPCMIVATDDANNVQGVVTGQAFAQAARNRPALRGTIEPYISKEYLAADVSDTVGNLVSKLASSPLEVVVVTDKGKYVGIIDRRKLADTVEEMLD